MVNEQSNNGKFSDMFFLTLVECELAEYASGTVHNQRKLFAAERLRSRLRKKYCPEGVVNKIADNAAIDKFTRIQREIAGRKLCTTPELIGEMRSYIYHVLERGKAVLDPNHIPGETLDVDVVLRMWNMGPGAAVGSEYTHFIEKLGGDTLTYSNESLHLLPLLAEISPSVFGRFLDRKHGERVLQVRGSESACVPKTPTISRFIGKQPVLNMAAQLAIGNWISACLRVAGLDISNQQEKNRWLAYIGSCSGETSGALRLMTVDLESASDFFQRDLHKQTLDFDDYRVLHFLDGIREQEIKIGSEWHAVESYSTMGCGFTFALMTLTIAAAVYAVGRCYLGWKRNYVPWDEVGVFGDDIICRSELFYPLCELLKEIGLKVNINKSFHTGHFRESCGGDYFDGYEVTPIYIKDLTTVQGRIIALNQLIGWMSDHNIFLARSFHYLVAGIPEKFRNLVPAWESDYAGIKTTAPLGSYTKAVLKFEPKVSHADAAFKLVCAVGGYLIPEIYSVMGKSCCKLPHTCKGEKTYNESVMSDIDIALTDELRKLLKYRDEGRIIYMTRESKSEYVLKHIDRDGFWSSIRTPDGLTDKMIRRVRGSLLRAKDEIVRDSLWSVGSRRYFRRTVELERFATIAAWVSPQP